MYRIIPPLRHDHMEIIGSRTVVLALAYVTNSKPGCKKSVALIGQSRKFNDMSAKYHQLKPHFPVPDINCLSSSTPAS